MTETAKRSVPSWLKNVLQVDAQLTKSFVIWANNNAFFINLRTHCKALEISCHGIPWFAFWIAFTWLFNNPHLIEMQVNILLGLLIDIILVAVAKAYFRRRRPASNKDDALGQIGPDVFSFPSGHASRAVFVAYFFVNLWPLSVIFIPFVVFWAFSVSLSRILMGRHYILDVTAGVILGLFEGLILSFLWVPEETAKSFIGFLSHENLNGDGGDYVA